MTSFELLPRTSPDEESRRHDILYAMRFSTAMQGRYAAESSARRMRVAAHWGFITILAAAADGEPRESKTLKFQAHYLPLMPRRK